MRDVSLTSEPAHQWQTDDENSTDELDPNVPARLVSVSSDEEFLRQY